MIRGKIQRTLTEFGKDCIDWVECAKNVNKFRNTHSSNEIWGNCFQKRHFQRKSNKYEKLGTTLLIDHDLSVNCFVMDSRRFRFCQTIKRLTVVMV